MRPYMAGSAMPPLTSFTSFAPAVSAASATSARIVSTLTVRPAPASSVMTGPTRRSSSSAEVRPAPGLVDSPPTSMMSAPWAASSRPRLIAARGANHLPPSEKESGVTFSTPMTRHRAGPGSPRTTGPAASPETGSPEAGRTGTDPAAACASPVMSASSWLPGRPGPRAAAAQPPQPPQAQLVRQLPAQPAHLQVRPDEEGLRLQRRQADPRRVPGAREHHEPRHPVRAELGIELVQRLDLEPPGHEQQDPPPGPDHRPGADPLAALKGGAKGGEIQRDPADPEFVRMLDGLDDQEVVQAGLGVPVAAHQVEREPVGAPGHEMQDRAQVAVLGGRRDHAAPVV